MQDERDEERGSSGSSRPSPEANSRASSARRLISSVAQGGYSSVSEYIRDLIRSDQMEKARRALETEVLAGLSSGPASAMTDHDWQENRAEIHRRHARWTQA